MPTMSVIERDFEKAVQIVKEEYPDVPEGSPQFWSLVFGVVKKMRGRKSARHLAYLGILEKADIPDTLFYLPYMFSQRVRGVDLFMDLPEHPAKLSPTSFPTFPAALSEFVDRLRALARQRGWSVQEFAENVLEHIAENPLMLVLSDDEFERLLGGGVTLKISEDINSDEAVGWKLVWIYAMLTKRIQPLTPRWGYKLAQLTRDVKDKTIQRINEHFANSPLPNPFGKLQSPFTLEYKGIVGGNIVIPTFIALHEHVRAVVRKSEWRHGGAEEYWICIRQTLGGIVPAWVAYALDLLGELDIKEVTFLPKPHITTTDVLCAFVGEKFMDEAPAAPFPLFTKPPTKSDVSRTVKKLMRSGQGGAADLKDEIIATVHPRWLVL